MRLPWITSTLGLIILDVCWIRARIKEEYIFYDTFPLYRLSSVDVWYHIALALIITTIVLLLKKEGDKVGETKAYKIWYNPVSKEEQFIDV